MCEAFPQFLLPYRCDKALYELHITVICEEARLADFQQTCSALGAKGLLIVLPKGEHQRQVQSGFHKYGSMAEVFDILKTQQDSFTKAGFTVVRSKVELKLGTSFSKCVPLLSGICPNGQYFEFHLQVRLHYDRLAELEKVSSRHNAHLSRNAYKTDKELGLVWQFLTLRFHDLGLDASQDRFHALRESLLASNFEVVKTESEYAIYDSNVNVDAGWAETSSKMTSAPRLALWDRSSINSKFVSCKFSSVGYYVGSRPLLLPLMAIGLLLIFSGCLAT